MSNDDSLEVALGARRLIADRIVQPPWFYVLNAIVVGLSVAAFSFGLTGMSLGAAGLILSQTAVLAWRRNRSQVVVGPKPDSSSARYLGGYYLLVGVLLVGSILAQELLQVDFAMVIAGGIVLFASLVLPALADRKLKGETV